MNTRQKAKEQILDFINSDRRCLLLTGTHMYEKHRLVLSTIRNEADKKNILFRVNGLKNLDTILNASNNFKTGTAYEFGSNDIYFDSFDSKTWKNSPSNLDYGVIYPIDSMISQKSVNKKPITNIINKGCEKLFLIGWSEKFDSSLFDEFVDQKVVFDVEEEDIEYHKRVIDGLRK